MTGEPHLIARDRKGLYHVSDTCEKNLSEAGGFRQLQAGLFGYQSISRVDLRARNSGIHARSDLLKNTGVLQGA